DHRRPRELEGRARRRRARRLPRQLWQGALPGARALHDLRAHGRDPGRAPHRTLRRAMKTVAVTATALALGIVPFALSSYHLGLVTKMLILAIFAMSLNLILGYAGLPSLGHAAYFGVAGYTAAFLALRGLDHFWLELGAGLLAAAATAALFGMLALRTRGAYLLMITLALAQVLWGIAFGWRS